jgi:hypothetical protein
MRLPSREVLFAVMMTIAPIWFAIMIWILHRLRVGHPSTYEEIGSPTLFWNNSTRSQWLLFKFMCSSRPSQLGDPSLTNMVRFMRILLLCYLTIFSVTVHGEDFGFCSSLARACIT